MNKCSKCERPLNDGEDDLCPSCKSNESHKKKKGAKIIGGVLMVVGGIAIKVLTGGKYK